MCEKVEKLYETRLKNYGSPLEGGYHPELDKSDLLVGDEVSHYRMLLGSANWAVTLGGLTSTSRHPLWGATIVHQGRDT